MTAPPSTDALLAGRYRLLGPVGRGGMAQVFAADDVAFDRQVAVKIMESDDPDAATRFLAERHVLARMNHPAIVRAFDAGTTAEGCPFLVMEYIDGCSLAHALQPGPMIPGDVRGLGLAVAGALAHAHAHGVIHRDVKPANILLGAQGGVWLTDFGIAHQSGAATLTRTGTLVGTAAYLSPEQVSGQAVTAAADLYSLGLVLIEAATGNRVFPGTSLEAALARLQRDPEIGSGVPPELADLLRRMTRRDPGRRPTAQGVRRALEHTDPRATRMTVMRTASLVSGAGGRTFRGRLARIGAVAAVSAGIALLVVDSGSEIDAASAQAPPVVPAVVESVSPQTGVLPATAAAVVEVAQPAPPAPPAAAEVSPPASSSASSGARSGGHSGKRKKGKK